MNPRRSALAGPAGRRPALLAAVFLGMLMLAVLLLAGRASAAPAAPSPSPPTASASASPSPAASSSPAAPAPAAATAQKSGQLSKAQQSANWQKALKAYTQSHPGGVLGMWGVTDSHGIPISAYTIDEDTGGLTDWDLKVYHMATSGCFLCAQWAVAVACWLIAWALSFSLAKLLIKPVMAVSDALYSNLMVAMGLPALVLTFAGVTAAWHLMFGDRGRGWAQLAASLVISALSVTALVSPPQLLLGTGHGAVGRAREMAVAVGATILGKTDHDFSGTDASAALARPITDSLTTTFVVQPAELLTYGQTFSGACANEFASSRIAEAVYQQQTSDFKEQAANSLTNNWLTDPLSGVPFGKSIYSGLAKAAMDWGQSTFGTKDPNGAFAADCHATQTPPSLSKAFAALFCAVAAVLACLLVIASTTTFLGAQAAVAWEAMVGRCALAAGVMPGPGRAWLWERLTSTGRALAMMVVTVAVLAITIVILNAITSAGPGQLPGGLPGRFIAIDVSCVCALIKRKAIVRRSRQWAEHARMRLGAGRLGGSAPSRLNAPQRRSRLASLARAGLVIGALAASGGTAAGMRLGSSIGYRSAARVLASQIGGAGRAAGRAVRGAAKAGRRVGAFGLKYSIGLPVYGPRAMQTARTLPATAAGRVTALRQRMAEVHARYAPPVRDFTGEYWQGIGGQRLLRRFRAPQPAPPPPPAAGRRPPAGAGRLANTPRRAPAAARVRLAPPRVTTPPASTRQAELQQRLHRIRVRRAAPPTPPTVVPPPQPPPRRPTPRPGRPGTARGRRRQ